MKDHLIFDVTNANTIVDSDSVGAFVRGSDGTLITQTGAALDVNIKTSDIAINVDINGIYDVGSNPTPDNVGVIAFNRAASPALSDQLFTPTGGLAGASAVVANTMHGLDVNASLMALNGAGTIDSLKSTTNALWVNVQNSTIAVTQSTSPWAVSDAALANVALGCVSNTNTLSVANTAQAAVASPLAARKYLWVYNYSNRKIFIGGAAVSAANGFPISPGSYMELRAGASSPVSFVGSTGDTPEIRTLELS